MSRPAFAAAPRIDPKLAAEVKHIIDHKTKPLGSLGQLESLALQLALAQGNELPCVNPAQTLVFAGDHGAAHHGISAYPPEVTAQMVHNFLDGGAAINVFSRLYGLDFLVVDAGVATPLPTHPRLINRKIAPGTRNFLQEPAMSPEQTHDAIVAGARMVEDPSCASAKVLVLGEMGIGNSSSASLITHCITGAPLQTCIGRGTGLDNHGLEKKKEALSCAQKRGGSPDDPFMALCEYGGFEGAMMVGAMAKAAQLQKIVLVDGFIVTASALVACSMYPWVRPYLVFAHRSREQGHRAALEHLEAKALLNLDLALGEGSGAALAYPLLQASAGFLREMASFRSAGVSTASKAQT